jgi:DNA-binding transcriptional ArsR family regulator
MTQNPPKIDARASVDQRLVKAMSHPLRVQLMMRLNGRVASPRQLSDMLDASLGTVSYHVQVLLGLELIELVRTEPRRGATEHFYRGIQRPFLSEEAWAQVPEHARESVVGVILRDIFSDIRAAVASGDFGRRDDLHLSRTPLLLDQQGWEHIRDLLSDALDEILLEQARAAARMVENPGAETLAVESAIVLFPTAPTDGD